MPVAFSFRWYIERVIAHVMFIYINARFTVCPIVNEKWVKKMFYLNMKTSALLTFPISRIVTIEISNFVNLFNTFLRIFLYRYNFIANQLTLFLLFWIILYLMDLYNNMLVNEFNRILLLKKKITNIQFIMLQVDFYFYNTFYSF